MSGYYRGYIILLVEGENSHNFRSTHRTQPGKPHSPSKPTGFSHTYLLEGFGPVFQSIQGSRWYVSLRESHLPPVYGGNTMLGMTHIDLTPTKVILDSLLVCVWSPELPHFCLLSSSSSSTWSKKTSKLVPMSIQNTWEQKHILYMGPYRNTEYLSTQLWQSPPFIWAWYITVVLSTTIKLKIFDIWCHRPSTIPIVVWLYNAHYKLTSCDDFGSILEKVHIYPPSLKLTYLTLRKGKSSSKNALIGNM